MSSNKRDGLIVSAAVVAQGVGSQYSSVTRSGIIIVLGLKQCHDVFKGSHVLLQSEGQLLMIMRLQSGSVQFM